MGKIRKNCGEVSKFLLCREATSGASADGAGKGSVILQLGETITYIFCANGKSLSGSALYFVNRSQIPHGQTPLLRCRFRADAVINALCKAVITVLFLQIHSLISMSEKLLRLVTMIRVERNSYAW